MTYPLKQRQHILKVKERERLSYSQTSKRFSVSARSIQRWEKDLYPKETRNKPASKIDMNALVQDVKNHPDAYQYERAERFGVSTRGMCDALKRLRITRKKKSSPP